ncbi:hypothetical protein P885DRAFT_75983 [Corynascus similis CBS 632.67]
MKLSTGILITAVLALVDTSLAKKGILDIDPAPAAPRGKSPLSTLSNCGVTVDCIPVSYGYALCDAIFSGQLHDMCYSCVDLNCAHPDCCERGFGC